MANRAALRWCILLVLMLPLEACSLVAAALQRKSCVVLRVSTTDLPRDLRLRTRMSFAFDDRLIRFEAVAGMMAGELVVVAIAPYGVRLFTVRQRERDISVETHSTRKLEHVAMWVMDALHRIYWVRPRWDTEKDVPHDSSVNGDNARALRVTIDPYVAADDGQPTVRIRNPVCGYDAVVVNLAATTVSAVPLTGIANPGSQTN